MIYTSEPSCKEILPVYQKFANENIKNKKKNIDCYAIQIDSNDWKDKDSHAQNYIVRRVSKTDKFPCFILINSFGSLESGLVEKHITKNRSKYSTRTVDGLKEFEKALTGGKKIDGEKIIETFKEQKS